MNKKLIEDILKSCNETCPELTYENPLLDRNVAQSLSKSFIHILKVSDQNSKHNNNLRMTILEHIRQTCQLQSEGHYEINESLMSDIIKDFCTQKVEGATLTQTSVNKKLDEFLLKKMKGWDISSSFSTTITPEVIQALMNLNTNDVCLDTLLEDVIHWNVNKIENLNALKSLWNGNRTLETSLLDIISIKLKKEIERILLETCYEVLSNSDCSIIDMFSSNEALLNLVNKSSNSSECFQICSTVLNLIFIMTNFDSQIQKLISSFVEQVKSHCSHITFSVLYPLTLNPTVILLDFDVSILPDILKDKYIQAATDNLKEVHSASESDLIMLLSHFPLWFDIYFSKI